MRQQFTLDSGHAIHLRQFFIRVTDEGFLEGSQRHISEHVLKHLPDTIRKIFWDCDATLILEPKDGMLPDYTLIAHLECFDPVPDKEPGDYSRLLVAWFQNELRNSPVRLAHKALRKIDWNQHAENWID